MADEWHFTERTAVDVAHALEAIVGEKNVRAGMNWPQSMEFRAASFGSWGGPNVGGSWIYFNVWSGDTITRNPKTGEFFVDRPERATETTEVPRDDE